MKSNTVKRGTSGLCGVFRWFLFLFLVWFSVTMPKPFQNDTIAGSVAGLSTTAAEEMLVKP